MPSDSRPIRRNSNGQIVRGSGALNPRGARGGNDHRAAIRELIGERGERAYELLWQVAQGAVSIETLAREPGPNEDTISAAQIPIVRKVPSFRERIDCLMFLAEQLNGRAVASVDLTANVSVGPQRIDPSKLSDDELDALDGLLGKAEIVDGEVLAENASEPAQLDAGATIAPAPVPTQRVGPIVELEPGEALG